MFDLQHRMVFMFSFLAVIALSQTLHGAEVRLEVNLSPAGSFVAQTQKVDGVAERRGDQVSAKNIIVDVKSLQTSISLRDKHLHERLEVDKFPKVILASASGKGGKGKAVIQLRGKPQNVEGTYKIEDKMLKAKFPMKLSETGFGEISYMGVSVDDEIIVNVELPLVEAKEPSADAAQKSSKGETPQKVAPKKR